MLMQCRIHLPWAQHHNNHNYSHCQRFPPQRNKLRMTKHSLAPYKKQKSTLFFLKDISRRLRRCGWYREIQYDRLSAPSTLPANTRADIPPAKDLQKYKNSKSISSDNYFASARVEADRDQINRFQGAQAISSDMYYNTGNGRTRSSSHEGTLFWLVHHVDLIVPYNQVADEAAYQLEMLKSKVTDKATKVQMAPCVTPLLILRVFGQLKQMTSGFFSDLQTRYS